MATATETAPRTRITSTVVKETLPGTIGDRQAIPADFYNRDFWEIVHSLSDDQWRDHIVRVYRCDDRWEKAGSPPENFFKIDFDEGDIFGRWGGGKYKLWMYGPPKYSKIVIEPFRLELEGQPRIGGTATPVANGGQMVGATPGDSLILQILQEIRDQRQMGPNLLQESLRASMEIMSTAYKNAAATVGAQAASGGAPRTEDEFEKEFKRAMLQKMLNPPDPLASITAIGSIAAAFAGVMKEVTTSFAGGATKPDAMSMIVNALPNLGEKVVQGLTEVRLTAEANASAVRSQHAPRVIDQQPAPAPSPGASPAPSAGPTGVAPAASPPATTEQTKEAIVIQWIMEQIVERIQNTDMSGAALYDWLSDTAPSIVDQLKTMPKEDLLKLFANTPVLVPASTNPRLPKMIDEFLAASKEPAKA